MQEVVKVTATLYPIGTKFEVYERSNFGDAVGKGFVPQHESIDEYLELLANENIVLVSEPAKWIDKSDEQADLEIAPLSAEGRILQKAIIQYEFERIPLGFQDSNSSVCPWWSPIYEELEGTGIKEAFLPSLQWLFDNFYTAIISHFEPTPVNAAPEKKSILAFPAKKPVPPYTYAALVDFHSNVESSRDWETGYEEIDFIEIDPVKIFDLWPKQ